MKKLKCPYCRSNNTKRNGTRKDGTQKLYCNDCNKSFSPNTEEKPENYLEHENLIKSVKHGHFEELITKLDTYEDLLDKYLTLQTEVQGFIDKLDLELEEPNVSTLNEIKGLCKIYSELFNCDYYNLNTED